MSLRIDPHVPRKRRRLEILYDSVVIRIVLVNDRQRAFTIRRVDSPSARIVASAIGAAADGYSRH